MLMPPNFPDDVKKLALLDALLPGIEPVWSQVKAQAWWFGFFAQPHAGELVSGKVGLFFNGLLAGGRFSKIILLPRQRTRRIYPRLFCARRNYRCIPLVRLF
jgi:hypothetical protein